MRKKFVTMFPECENIHLVKDVGMFPYCMHKYFGYDSLIACFKNSPEYSYLNSDVSGLKIEFIPSKNKRNLFDCIKYLKNNALTIDVLNLYHSGKRTFILLRIYKFFNPGGKVFVKLDMDERGVSSIKKLKRRRIILKWILKNADIVSVECEGIKKTLKDIYHKDVLYIPNGIEKENIECIKKKEKIILTVGRLGTEQKASEIMLQAFEQAVPEISLEWKLILVGSMTPEFRLFYQDKVKNNTDLAARIEYLGEIFNREQLNELYRRACIFTMSSRWEGFALVGIEALSKGDYMLTTNIMSFRELCDYGSYGTFFTVDNIEEYSSKIVNLCQKVDNGGKLLDSEKLCSYMHEKYSYESICTRLDNALGST